MVDATGIVVTNASPGLGATLLKIDYTKANATDVVNIPEGYGETVIWCDFNKESTLVKDPATAVTALAITMSAGTGDFTGLVMVE